MNDGSVKAVNTTKVIAAWEGDLELAKKLYPKMRCYAPVIVRGEENEGVKFWGFGKQVYAELLGFIADPDYGDITDLTAGRDIVVEFTPSEGAGTFPKTAIRVKPNQTAATEDKAIADKIVSGQKEIFSIFKKVSYDDLKAALEAWLSPEDSNEEAGDLPWEKENTESNKPKAAEKAPVGKTDDISKAFDDLFS